VTLKLGDVAHWFARSRRWDRLTLLVRGERRFLAEALPIAISVLLSGRIFERAIKMTAYLC